MASKRHISLIGNEVFPTIPTKQWGDRTARQVPGKNEEKAVVDAFALGGVACIFSRSSSLFGSSCPKAAPRCSFNGLAWERMKSGT